MKGQQFQRGRGEFLQPFEQGLLFFGGIQKFMNKEEAVGHLRSRHAYGDKILFKSIRGQGDFRVEDGSCQNFQIEKDMVNGWQKRDCLVRRKIAGGFNRDGNILLPELLKKRGKGLGMKKGFAPGEGDTATRVAIECFILQNVLTECFQLHLFGGEMRRTKRADLGQDSRVWKRASGAKRGVWLGGCDAFPLIEEGGWVEGDGLRIGAPGAGKGASLEKEGGADARAIMQAVALDADYGEGEGHDGAVRRMNSS